MPLNLDELKARVKHYVEMEASTTVISVEFAEAFTLFDIEDVVFSVVTTDPEEPHWWVVGGSTPINLYTKSKFNSSDEAFSMHTGLILRMRDHDFKAEIEPPEGLGYDAFISHASEDKEAVARPLADALKSLGFWVWYDEFSLEIGDSLRQSIDKGLANSRFGIVILSPAFFSKQWPQYELNGLTAKEVEGTKVILPIWHNLEKVDILKHSPPLADKLAVSTRQYSVEEVARRLSRVLLKA